MLRRYFKNSFFIIASVVGIMASPSFAAPREKKEVAPIVITSDRMEAEKLGDKVTFTGKVTLKKEGMTLTSDAMTVFYDPGSKNVRLVEATGNVQVRKEGRVALANKAIYSLSEEKIVLTGDARIIENENRLGGEKITLFLRDDRSVVESGKVLLYQEQIDKTKEKKPQK
jgi:lipopolysaccharide export system protein LptA